MRPPIARAARASQVDLRARRPVTLTLFELVILHDALGLVLFPEDHDRLGLAGEQLEILQRRLAGELADAGIRPADISSVPLTRCPECGALLEVWPGDPEGVCPRGHTSRRS